MPPRPHHLAAGRAGQLAAVQHHLGRLGVEDLDHRPCLQDRLAVSCGEGSAGVAAWHQIAARATVYCRWGDRFPFPERFEIAWAGVVDHLAGCEECAQEIASLREATARLATATAVAPPSGLKEKVMATAALTRQQPPPVSPAEAETSPRASAVRPWFRALARPHRLAMTAAAVAVLAVALVFGISNGSMRDQLNAAQDRSQQIAAVLTPLLSGIAADSAPQSQLDLIQRTLLSRPNLVAWRPANGARRTARCSLAARRTRGCSGPRRSICHAIEVLRRHLSELQIRN